MKLAVRILGVDRRVAAQAADRLAERARRATPPTETPADPTASEPPPSETSR